MNERSNHWFDLKSANIIQYSCTCKLTMNQCTTNGLINHDEFVAIQNQINPQNPSVLSGINGESITSIINKVRQNKKKQLHANKPTINKSETHSADIFFRLKWNQSHAILRHSEEIVRNFSFHIWSLAESKHISPLLIKSKSKIDHSKLLRNKISGILP